MNFQDKDPFDVKYGDYVTRHKTNPYMAVCTICRKDLAIDNIGKAALKQHCQGKQHRESVTVLSGNSQQSMLPFRRLDEELVDDPNAIVPVPPAPASTTTDQNANVPEVHSIRQAGSRALRYLSRLD